MWLHAIVVGEEGAVSSVLLVKNTNKCSVSSVGGFEIECTKLCTRRLVVCCRGATNRPFEQKSSGSLPAPTITCHLPRTSSPSRNSYSLESQ